MGVVSRLDPKFYLAVMPTEEGELPPAKRAEEPLFVRKVCPARGPDDVEVTMELRNNEFALSSALKRAYQELAKIGWPMMDYGLFAVGTRKPSEGGKAGVPEKGLVLDCDTLLHLFHPDNHPVLLEGVRIRAEKLCEEWNERYGGALNRHNRQPTQARIPLRHLAVEPAGKNKETRNHTLVVELSCFQSVGGLQDRQDAKMTPRDLHANLKVLKGVGEPGQPPLLSYAGLYLPYDRFMSLGETRELKEVVAEAQRFLERLPEGGMVRHRFSNEAPSEEELREMDAVEEPVPLKRKPAKEENARNAKAAKKK